MSDESSNRILSDEQLELLRRAPARIGPESYVDLHFDPDPSRKRDGLIALIATINDARLLMWARDDASLSEILLKLKQPTEWELGQLRELVVKLPDNNDETAE